MPERENYNLSGKDVVVDVVANTIKLEAAQLGILSRGAALPDAGLKSEQLGGSLEVFGDRAGSCGSVGSPPFSSSFKLRERSWRDFDGEHRPSVGAQPVQDFRDRNRLTTN
jgi:hypothetical protein